MDNKFPGKDITDEDIKTMGVGSDSGDDEQDGKEDDSEE